MFVKIHEQIFSSSIMEEDLEVRYIWICLLALCDSEGFIDMTIPSIARRINIDAPSVEKAIMRFMEPDPTSRTTGHEGRRLEPIRENFGWQIINYTYYRELRDLESRKEQNRKAKRRQREREKSANVIKRQQPSSMSAQGEGEGEAEAEKRTLSKKLDVSKSFLQFWTAYPRKVKRKEAVKAWSRLNPAPELLTEMLAALEVQKVSDDWLKDNGQFIPLPPTWLNGERWKDEVRQAPKEKTLAEFMNQQEGEHATQ